jgi:hypothetical protein
VGRADQKDIKTLSAIILANAQHIPELILTDAVGAALVMPCSPPARWGPCLYCSCGSPCSAGYLHLGSAFRPAPQLSGAQRTRREGPSQGPSSSFAAAWGGLGWGIQQAGGKAFSVQQ